MGFLEAGRGVSRIWLGGGDVHKAGGPGAPTTEELVARVPPPLRGYMPCPPKGMPAKACGPVVPKVYQPVVPAKVAPGRKRQKDEEKQEAEDVPEPEAEVVADVHAPPQLPLDLGI